MELEVQRFSSQEDDTLGVMHDVIFEDQLDPHHREFWCFTLEDEYRKFKVAGETRILAGRYKCKLRTDGRNHKRYLDRYGEEWHKGMIELIDVPRFTAIQVHCGNKDDHTDGCTLVGDISNQNITEDGTIGSSRTAYERIYPRIRDTLLAEEEVWITYIDYA